MPSPSRSDLLGAAQHRVKDLAQSAQGAAVDLARDLASRYERSSRYFKMRAAVVGSWAVLAGVALWIACPSSGPRNSLGADVQVIDTALLGPQVLVRNESDRMWTEVVLLLDGGWRYERKTVRPGDKLVVSIAQFRREKEPAPKDLRPRQLMVRCAQGAATVSLSPR